MNAKKVSVIVPFYNAEATLDRALESIAASSHKNIEVLMVDDCSTDQSGAIAGAFSHKDGRFRYFRNPENKNVSCCRNKGLDQASGDFLLFVDSDDRISPDWIGNLLNDAADVEIVIGKARRLRGEKESDYEMAGLRRRGNIEFEDVVFKDNSVVWNKLYSAALLKREGIRFDESLCIGEDLLFNFQVMAHARGIFYNDSGYYYYRADNEFSIMRSSTPEKRISNLSRLLHILVEYSRTIEKKNSATLRKVARDILMTQYRFVKEPTDYSTMKMIREIDGFLPFKVRFSVFRKKMRSLFIPQSRTK